LLEYHNPQPRRPFTIAAPVNLFSTMTKSKAEVAPADEGFSLISNRKLLTLYAAMLECRRIAEGARNRRGSNGAGSLLGHEAIAVGAAIDLLARDTVAAHWPDAALQAINPFISIASSASRAASSARANHDGRRVTLVFSSSKPGAQPAWLKSLALAADHNLPMLFVSLTPAATASQPFSVGSIPTRRRGYALPQISVDGKDVVAVYRVASEAIAHARKGHGPTLIECPALDAGDPLENMRKYLTGKGLFPF
jgi:TPP-dependent pyruvate/acetoin dehydrogenase alpha subunit